MNRDFMPDLTGPQRLQLLRDTAYESEETFYYRDLTQEQLDIKREELSGNLIEISKLDDVLDEAKVAYKSKAQPLKVENQSLLTEIKNRRSEVNGLLFHLANFEESTMETYNDLGEFISSRRLKPHEKQKQIFTIPSKTAEQ